MRGETKSNTLISASYAVRDPTHRFGTRPDGLIHCVACHGAEAELPTECPGVPLNEDQRWYITNRKLDFVDGKWSSDCQMLNPSGDCRCGLGRCKNCLIL